MFVILTTLLPYLFILGLDLGDVWLVLRFSGPLTSKRVSKFCGHCVLTASLAKFLGLSSL